MEKEDTWEDLLDYIKLHCEEISSTEIFPDFRKTILDLLLAENCDSAMVVSNIVGLINAHYQGVQDLRESDDFLSLRLASMMKRITQKPKVSFNSEHDCKQMLLALVIKDSQYLRMLVKYGFKPKIDEKWELLEELALDCLNSFLSDVCNFDFDSCASCTENLMEILFYRIQGLFKGSKHSIMKRIYLIFLVINDLMDYCFKNEGSLTDDEYYLEVYFRAIPDPLVSLGEIKNVLKCICSFLENSNLMNFSHEDLFEKFVEEKPSVVTKKHQPRSLSQLVRCKIRENISHQRELLPIVVDKLNLPKKVKNFVLCM